MSLVKSFCPFCKIELPVDNICLNNCPKIIEEYNKEAIKYYSDLEAIIQDIESNFNHNYSIGHLINDWNRKSILDTLNRLVYFLSDNDSFYQLFDYVREKDHWSEIRDFFEDYISEIQGVFVSNNVDKLNSDCTKFIVGLLEYHVNNPFSIIIEKYQIVNDKNYQILDFDSMELPDDREINFLVIECPYCNNNEKALFNTYSESFYENFSEFCGHAYTGELYYQLEYYYEDIEDMKLVDYLQNNVDIESTGIGKYYGDYSDGFYIWDICKIQSVFEEYMLEKFEVEINATGLEMSEMSDLHELHKEYHLITSIQSNVTLKNRLNTKKPKKKENIKLITKKIITEIAISGFQIGIEKYSTNDDKYNLNNIWYNTDIKDVNFKLAFKYFKQWHSERAMAAYKDKIYRSTDYDVDYDYYEYNYEEEE